MTDAKDALEELKRVRGDIKDIALGDVGPATLYLWDRAIDAAIAALEKERAMWQERFDAQARHLDTEMDHCTQYQMELTALRAAVEKVRDQVRGMKGLSDAGCARLADALDAALRGGA